MSQGQLTDVSSPLSSITVLFWTTLKKAGFYEVVLASQFNHSDHDELLKLFLRGDVPTPTLSTHAIES